VVSPENVQKLGVWLGAASYAGRILRLFPPRFPRAPRTRMDDLVSDAVEIGQRNKEILELPGHGAGMSGQTGEALGSAWSSRRRDYR